MNSNVHLTSAGLTAERDSHSFHLTAPSLTPESLSETTDRDLLERAAKAAGVKREIEWLGHHEYLPDWSPLESDGDALRLLAVLPRHDMLTLYVGRAAVVIESDGGHVAVAEKSTDTAAALRRAIVRAAAALATPKDSPPSEAEQPSNQ